jgi:hypothetical protein
MFPDYEREAYRLIMLMGNYLRTRTERHCTMAATNQSVAIDHQTVVPENFDPDDADRPESGNDI